MTAPLTSPHFCTLIGEQTRRGKFMGMKRRSFLCSSAALAGIGILGSGDDQGNQVPPHIAHAASLMTECANRFLTTLDAGQRGKATFPFDTDERMNWHYVPKERKGLRQINKAGRNIYFAWVGRHQPRRPALLPRSDTLHPHRIR